MKNFYVVFIALLFFVMLLCPIFAIQKSDKDTKNAEPAKTVSASASDEKTFSVKMSEDGKIKKIGVKEYVFGVVAAEMPMEYKEEALKAQAVAAYTYALYKSEEAANAGRNYDLGDSGSDSQCFITRKAAREKWGEKADEYEKKLDKIVAKTSGSAILYDGKPILAAYHAISAGKTENASEIWGGEYPYLKTVDSVGDLLNPDYLTQVSVTAEEFAEKLKDKSIDFSGDPTGYLGEKKCSSVGSVIKIAVCGKEISGEEMRAAFGLRSADFDAAFEDGKFVFTVRGYGHGVGMSQYGAERMAEDGSNYIEILSAYYTGCKLGKVYGK